MTMIHLRAALLGSSALLFATTVHAETAAASDDGGSVAGVVVTAPRKETVARARQFEAPNLINVQAAETIEKYPDFNAAEALGRMPGISISTDTGEGRFVNIRGIDGNLVGATFGGVPLLNTNPGGTYFGGGGRAVEFDTIPTGSIDGLVVFKTTLPDHEAEGLGGAIELTPRTAANIERPFVEGTLGYGYEPEHNHGGPLDMEIAVGGRFGFDGSHMRWAGDGAMPAAGGGWISNPEPFSFVLTASQRNDSRGFDDIEEDYNDPTVDRSYADIQLRRYNYQRRRFGYGGEFDFQPNDENAWYIRGNVAGYRESVQKNRLTYDNLGDTPDPSNPSGFATSADVTLSSTDEEETHRNQVYVAGGRNELGNGIVLDYRGSYSRATYTVDRNFGATFTGPTVAFAYDNSGNNGDFPVLRVTDGTDVNNPALYNLKNGVVSDSTEHDVDQERAYAANLFVPMHFVGDDNVKIGGEVRFRDKTVTPYAYQADVGPLNLSQVSGPAVTDFYGRYSNGPQVNTVLLRNMALIAGEVGGVDLTGVSTSKEDIYAGYAQYQTQIGKWGLLAGVRVEGTDATYGAYSDDNLTQTLQFVEQEKTYVNVFPTFQIRYQATPNFLIRATYSTGIARPGFNQVTAATSSNHDPSDPQISQGNPNLNPTTGNNFDLSLEYYLPNGGILQLGLFDKEFDNYIVTEVQHQLYTGTDPEFAGLIATYTTYANRSGAWARGVEAAYHQQFTFLPGFWSGFGVDGNLTLVSSHIEEYDAATSATGVAESGLLPGTSRVTANLSGFYEAHGVQLRLAGEYVSKELFSLGGSKATDTIQDNRLTLDFTSAYQVTDNAQVYFKVKNLTNEPLRFYIDNPSFPIQREFYDQTYEAGVRFKF